MAALEFALIAPFFLMLLFGIIIYGIYFATWIAATEAAAQGARASIAGLTDAQRLTYATAAANAVLTPYGNMISCALTPAPASVTISSGITGFKVSVSCSFNSFAAIGSLVAFPTSVPPVSITVSNGGYQ